MKKDSPYRILIMRFSSLGDVAMTIPVVNEFIKQNPYVKITFVSREKFKPLFIDSPNVDFYVADLDGKHKGVWGLYRLYKELRELDIYAIADLHNVLRTKILRKYFSSHAIKFAVLDKGRDERKALTRKENKIRKQLKPMTERYADVFRELGFELELPHTLIQNNSEKENAIGIAPFAMYEGKMYPIEQMRSVALKIAEKGLKVYLFGGKAELEELKSWEKLNPNIISTVCQYDLKGELELIKKLKLMVSMDSANMHLASLVGVRVISIWGNTHPFAGFLGYGQSMDDVIQDETLTMRPTSIFGKEASNTKKVNYFENVSSKLIIEKIESYLD
ncbi:glycosyltransferase family 9 protein [Moheibacter sediminis]|uniref:ADP-heptose:LPS heptosyltransferase n=1 Tax=Moheibacter sediminis TaxID=1434700 RepID=A0A1W1Y749_9FLAO|nr:glycosyltransferase family 9 protein [Moheibacter sediminis]SMC31955.1 ADP-heptose:LPS heptosyltransferase [Moheibacter sediminis]